MNPGAHCEPAHLPKVSVNNSQIGFVHIHFSIYIFPYMSENHESGSMRRSGTYEKSKSKNPENSKNMHSLGLIIVLSVENMLQNKQICCPEMEPYGSI